MAVVTAAVVGTAVAIKSTIDAKKAQKKAASDIEDAQIESAELLADVGREAEADILREQVKAAKTVGLGAEEAEARIAPFAGPGSRAFAQAQEQILGGLPASGPLADAIRQGSTDFVTSRPELFDISGPVGAEVQRQGELSVSGASPAFRQNLLAAGIGGISAAGDIGAIRQRGLEGLADIAGATGAQRASVLVGQAPQLAQLAAGAGEARLLGDVAGQQANVNITESLAQLAGRVL